MEEKNINEKESLELISQMIQSTKEYIEVGNGNQFLYWGYFTALLAVVVEGVYHMTESRHSGWLWMLMFVFWIFMAIINKRKHHTVITYINKVVNHVWYVIGLMFIVTFAVIFTYLQQLQIAGSDDAAICHLCGYWSIDNRNHCSKQVGCQPSFLWHRHRAVYAYSYISGYSFNLFVEFAVWLVIYCDDGYSRTYS